MVPSNLSVEGISDLFSCLTATAVRTEDKAAVLSSDWVLTYGDLVNRADGFCAQLEASDIRSGDRVAVMVPNGPAFAIAAYAIWKRGAILVPLHVSFQEEEIVRHFLDSGVKAVVASIRMRALAQSILERKMGVEHVWLCPSDNCVWKYLGGRPQADSRRDNSAANPRSEWPALTQYSTGSTGFSKRVTRTHRQLIGEFKALSKVMEFTQGDRILAAAPFFHNYGLMNALICGTLSGATLYTINDFFPRDVVRLIETEKITGFPGVPFMYQLMANERRLANFSALRYALSAGAPLPEATARAFRSKYAVPVRQLYGCTETGVISIERRPVNPDVTFSVGSPIQGVTIRIMDDSHKVVRDGTEGNVWVSSPFAASRYDNLDSRSESYFKHDGFFPGDLGRVGSDGQLVLVGRRRHFINVGGNKVDPVEVESILREHPAIAEAVVLGVPDGAAGEKIKAVIVPSSGCNRKEVFEHCVARLADFKRPRIIEFRKEIPKSPLGKILRKYLIEPYEAQTVKWAFDPRNGFHDTETEKSGDRQNLDLATVPPFLRVLLATDGTVTKCLEAYFWEPIDVELLFHVQKSSEEACSEIEVQAGDTVIVRRVVMRGRITGSAYAFAETIIASDRFSADLKRRLVEDKLGIGQLLRDYRLETYRELVGVERGNASQWAGYLGVEPAASVIMRSYKIYLERRPSVRIVEVFPDSRFQSAL